MKDKTRKEIEESIADLEKAGGKSDLLVLDVIVRLKKALKFEDDKKEDKDGPGTEN